MKAFIIVSIIMSLSGVATASTKKKVAHESSKNIEVWCGTPIKHQSDFPYLAAIRNYTSKKRHGHIYQVATVYKYGRAIYKVPVYKTNKGAGLAYTNKDDDFNLSITSESTLNSIAGFRAVIHNRDGATLVENGQMPCHRQHS